MLQNTILHLVRGLLIFNNTNISQLSNHLNYLQWKHVLECNDTALSYKIFSNTFQEIYNAKFPITK